MGIMTRAEGDLFVITSDRPPGEWPTKHAPRRVSEGCQVWTGTQWSPTRTEAMTFTSLEAADEYVRANFRQITE
jgi:hypothetical protein